MPRAARRKSESGIYHVMLRGINQQQIFENEEDYEKFLQTVYDCKQISSFEVYAYCLMGNHIHLLLKEGNEPLELVFKRIGGRFVYWYNLKYGRVGHLFQDRFKSEPVETDADLLTVLRYIHQNPLKAQLCKDLKDYEYSSFREYLGKPYIIDPDRVFGMITKEDFEAYNYIPTKRDCLDITENKRVLLSDDAVKKEIEKTTGCKSATEFQELEREIKQNSVKWLYKNGASIRQLSRLTGCTKGMVEKWIKM